MASYNKIMLIGNLGRDPEVREYQGRKVANFSLAVNEKYTKSDGSSVERTEWFRVTFWGNTAETVEKYLKKGSQVFVEGRLSTQEFKDKEGMTRTALEVSGQGLTMLGGQSGSMSNSGSTGTESSYSGTENDYTPNSSGEDDLPF
ncbi:MAG: single-stranded DNA-binding protein [Microscillaceae bacterium]|nr:single-stranded DNA-binding protein [Microscillaceae bacterium]